MYHVRWVLLGGVCGKECAIVAAVELTSELLRQPKRDET